MDNSYPIGYLIIDIKHLKQRVINIDQLFAFESAAILSGRYLQISFKLC